MNKSLLSLTLAATALTATAANAAPTSVSNGPVQAHATIVKPLTLTKVSDMDFGSIVVQDDGTASLSNAGTLACPATLTCASTGTPAEYTVTGTNNQVVFITKPNVTLPNGLDPNKVSHDREVGRAYKSDPLKHVRISPRLLHFIIGGG